MGIFATRVRRGVQVVVRSEAEQVPDRGHHVPSRFEAVAENLAAGRDASNACAAVGRESARDGADLGEALDGLRTTYARVRGGEPDFRTLRALCLAWGEETLAYLHQLSCEDPLTGLASLAHLRARLTEVFRGAGQGGTSPAASHALVVVDLLPQPGRAPWDAFDAALATVRLAEAARRAFPGDQTLAQARGGRLVVLSRRDDDLAARVALARELVGQVSGPQGRSRVWVEGLPPSDEAAGRLLDELTRT